MNHIADNQDALLDYLYEEGDPAERLKIATHLHACAECSVAVLEFQNVRGILKEWTPPASQLGFRVTQEAPRVPRSAFIAAPWLQAAAAILLFVSGMAFSQLNVKFEDGVVTIARRSAEPEIPVFSGRDIQLPTERVSAEPLNTRAQSSAASAEDVERLLQQVRAMIDQSEQRQKGELALRLSQVAREVDTQHQADLLRIQQDFGQQQQATMDYLVRTSGGTR
jgi:hypothetical protein